MKSIGGRPLLKLLFCIRCCSLFSYAEMQMRTSVELVVPADPLREPATHHLLEVLAFQPRQLFGEHGHALPVAAGHAGDVGSPEQAIGTVGVEDPMQAIVQILERVGMR